MWSYPHQLGLYDLGFSWVEIGSVTPKPQVRASFLCTGSIPDLLGT